MVSSDFGRMQSILKIGFALANKGGRGGRGSPWGRGAMHMAAALAG